MRQAEVSSPYKLGKSWLRFQLALWAGICIAVRALMIVIFASPQAWWICVQKNQDRTVQAQLLNLTENEVRKSAVFFLYLAAQIICVNRSTYWICQDWLTHSALNGTNHGLASMDTHLIGTWKKKWNSPRPSHLLFHASARGPFALRHWKDLWLASQRISSLNCHLENMQRECEWYNICSVLILWNVTTIPFQRGWCLNIDCGCPLRNAHL